MSEWKRDIDADTRDIENRLHWAGKSPSMAAAAEPCRLALAYIARVRELEAELQQMRAESAAGQTELADLRTQVGVRRRGLEGRV